MHRTSNNIAILTICQGLSIAATSIDLTLTGLTGYQLAPQKWLATLPFALITVAGAFVTYFGSLIMGRIGRKGGFIAGSVACFIGGLISVWAVFHNEFWLFCFGTACVGVFQAFAQYYRLAAADSVAVSIKAKAISIVMAGGVVAAVLGPALAAWSKNFFPALFAGSYLMVGFLGMLSMLVLVFGYRDTVTREGSVQTDFKEPARSVYTVMKQPISLAALANNVVAGVVMMFIMTASPLAAVRCGHSIDDGANIIQWHLVGMYAPALFAGQLIKRFGLPTVLLAGIFLMAACILIAAWSISLPSFYVALLCLGIGWNFTFVGGTTLLAQSYRVNERAKVQGAAELFRYTATALATLAAGPILEWYGWNMVNFLMFPFLGLAVVMTLIWIYSKAPVPAEEYATAESQDDHG
jgi:MFS family permease